VKAKTKGLLSNMPVHSAERDLWCRRYRPSGNPGARLVCLPHAGGSAPFFLPVAAALSPGVDVIAVQYPGRQDRRSERPAGDMTDLADRIYQVLRGEPELPLALFGHSLGAAVAFEVARRLEADGLPPARLFASARRSPSMHRDENVHLRDDAGILAELRRLNGTSSALLGDDEVMRAALPSLRADYRIAETYQCTPQDTISSPVTALTGDRDPQTTLEEAKGWARHTTGAFDLHVFTGGHFYLTDHADAVIKILDNHFKTEVTDI
jgi:surfactin synthase thioesterase subunit